VSYERFQEAAYRPTGFNLVPYSFEELELFPGGICEGTAHFDTDAYGGWSVSHVELRGLKGPDAVVSDQSTGDAAVIFRLIADTLRDRYEEHILGTSLVEA
jgi:hypothetical protein